MDSGAWVEIVDEWGQASWRNSLTGGLSWQNPSAKDPGSKIAVQAPNVPSKNIHVAAQRNSPPAYGLDLIDLTGFRVSHRRAKNLEELLHDDAVSTHVSDV